MDYPHDPFAQDQLMVNSLLDNQFEYEMSLEVDRKVAAALKLEKLKKEEENSEQKEPAKITPVKNETEGFSNFSCSVQYLYVIIAFLLAVVISQHISHQNSMCEIYKVLLTSQFKADSAT